MCYLSLCSDGYLVTRYSSYLDIARDWRSGGGVGDQMNLMSEPAPQ